MTNENQKGSNLDPEDVNEELVESSESVVQAGKGLQQHFAPESVANLVAKLAQMSNVIDLTAGDGSLLRAVARERRFGIEIDKDQIANSHKDDQPYYAIQGDLQQVAPLLSELGDSLDLGFAALNPPYGLEWEDSSLSARLGSDNASINSTIATFIYAHDLLVTNGQGLMICGKNRYEREIKPLFTSGLWQENTRPYVYAELTVPDMWPEVGVEIVVVCWVKRLRRGWGTENTPAPEPLRLTLAPNLLDEDQIVERLAKHRASFNNHVDLYAYQSRREQQMFEAVQVEYDIRTAAKSRKRKNDYDVYSIAGKLRVNLKPYTLLTLQRNGVLNDVRGLDRMNHTYFVLNSKSWHNLVEYAESGWLRLEPRTQKRVEEIIAENAKKIVPMYEVQPQQRLAYLKDVGTVECVRSNEERGYVAGEHYPVVVRTNVVESFDRGRPVANQKTGEITLKDFVQVRKLLSIRIGNHRFSEEKSDIEFIIEHFAIPNPGTVSDRYPEEYEAMRDVLSELEAGRSWKFREFQKEDIARLLVKGDGLLAWEQGLGKTLAGLSFFKAHEKLGNASVGLIIAPQDLIPQWRREAKRFFGLELEWLRSYDDFRNCRDHLKKGGTGLYITHFEALSRTGKVDGKKHTLPLDMKVRYRLNVEPAYRTWEDDAGDGQPGYVTHPAKQELVPVTAETHCPGCLQNYRAGWVPGVRCNSCGWVHTEKKVKPLYNLIKNSFRQGVLIIDELTMIKGESDRSRALRGIKSKYTLGMTGTPVKNYIPDAFWGLWKCLGNATPRFPFDYRGGKTQFENDFAVVEFETTGYKRRGRKVLPEVTNLSSLWKLLAPAIVRRRKEETGETLVPRTFYEVGVPWGSQQRKQYKTWLYRFGEFFANENPDHPIVKAGAQDRMAAMLGQLHKLEFATTMPEVDYDRDYWGVEVSNWTPKNAKVLEIAMYHAKQGDKVLIGSAVKQLGRFLKEELCERGVKAVNILKDGEGAQDTKSPAARAKVVKEFQDGDAQVLVASVQAMSLGHNLDKGSVVILTGLPWDWSSLDQFIARVHRLTSEKDVRVYICLTEGSIDHKKWELLVRKGAAASLALDGRLIEEDEKKVDKGKFLQELKDAGVSVTNDAIPESEIQQRWQEITSVEDIGELDLEPTGDIEEIEVEDRAVPNPEQYDEPIGPEPEPVRRFWFVAHGTGTSDRIEAYLYGFARANHTENFPLTEKCIVGGTITGTSANNAQGQIDRLASGAYGAKLFEVEDDFVGHYNSWRAHYYNRELQAELREQERRDQELLAAAAVAEEAQIEEEQMDDPPEGPYPDPALDIEAQVEEEPEDLSDTRYEPDPEPTPYERQAEAAKENHPDLFEPEPTPQPITTSPDEFTFGF